MTPDSPYDRIPASLHRPSIPDAPRYGVYPAIVTDTADPDGLGRVRVRLPRSDDGTIPDAWARVSTLVTGKRSGSYFIPDVDTEVLVAFEGGDPRRPYVVGSLWNRDAPPPVDPGTDPQNTRKELRTRSGVAIAIDDAPGNARMVLSTPAGQSITLDGNPASIEIADGFGNRIKLDAGGIAVTAAARVSIRAAQVNISAGLMEVDAGMSKFSGVVQAETLVATSVVASNYTPGAGNVY